MERDGEILGFCFSGWNSIRALSIVLSRRERGERERERERERNIIKEIFLISIFFNDIILA